MSGLTNRYSFHRPEGTHQAYFEQTKIGDDKMASETKNTVTLTAGPSDFYLSGDFLPAKFRSESYQLTKDIVNYVCRHDDAILPPSKTAGIMRSLVDDTLKSRLELMCHLVTTLDVREPEQLHLIDNIVTDMFEDQTVNWGRIITLCAFCGYLARSCEERSIPYCADQVGQILGNIIINRLGLWIVANGGWAAFEGQFPNVCMFDKSGIWKGITIIILLIGAVFAFYSSVRFING